NHSNKPIASFLFLGLLSGVSCGSSAAADPPTTRNDSVGSGASSSASAPDTTTASSVPAPRYGYTQVLGVEPGDAPMLLAEEVTARVGERYFSIRFPWSLMEPAEPHNANRFNFDVDYQFSSTTADDTINSLGNLLTAIHMSSTPVLFKLM